MIKRPSAEVVGDALEAENVLAAEGGGAVHEVEADAARLFNLFGEFDFEEVEAVFLEFGGAKFVAEARHDSKLRKRVSRGINESEGGKATRKLGREFRERET